MSDETRTAESAVTEEKMSLKSTIKSFHSSFWIANTMEIVERMAWYGFYALSSIYMCDAVSDGGLGLTSADRGIVQGAVTFLIYLFPFVTGALGDRYGYKKMLLISYAIMAPSYWLLGQMETMPTFFAAFLCVGIGASIFKPLVVGTIGRVSNEKNGSLAFGIFYMMVNIGGFVGPLLATTLRSQGWDYVFMASSAWIALNIPILLLFYKEPPRDETAAKAKSFKQVMNEMFEVIGNGRFFVMFFVTLVMFVMGCKWFPIEQVTLAAFAWVMLNVIFDGFLRLAKKTNYCMRIGHKRFLLFLLLLSSFWIAYNQLFITLPLYIGDTINSQPVMDFILSVGSALGMDTSKEGLLAMTFMDKNGGLKPEHFVNINAFCIIVFQVIVSILNAKMKPLIAIMIGIFLTAVSFLLIGFGASPWLIMIGVAIFSFGEMMASPRAKEYTAHAVAPRDKVGMYMGYYMWSNAIGSLFGGILSGTLYKQIAQDMQSPGLMWAIFAGMSIVCCILIYGYHLKVGRKVASE
ncbi:MAG: MFS transporter [Proteobacteria bacterium]|nr:MFS transporter [Pseudomonadota bacterium]